MKGIVIFKTNSGLTDFAFWIKRTIITFMCDKTPCSSRIDATGFIFSIRPRRFGKIDFGYVGVFVYDVVYANGDFWWAIQEIFYI